MFEQDDPQLDATLRAFFRDTLDAHRGGAERGFRRHVKAEARGAWRNRSFLIGAFASGLAASVAVLWATPLFRPMTQSRPPVAVNAPGEPARADAAFVPVVERVVNSQTSDEGVVMLDDETPVRVYRRQAVERTRWFDENDAVRAQEVTPHDDLVLMKLTTY